MNGSLNVVGIWQQITPDEDTPMILWQQITPDEVTPMILWPMTLDQHKDLDMRNTVTCDNSLCTI